MQLLRPRLAKVLGSITVAVFLAGLVFRFAIYRHMHIGPNDPYGISDVIELLLGLLLLLALSVSAVGVIALAVRGPQDNRRAASWLFGSCLAIALLLDPLHSLAAKYAL